MATRMQQRRGTADQWTAADPVLAPGEIGFETDTGQFKIGDGTNHWADLSYFKDASDLGFNSEDYLSAELLGVADGVASLDENGKIPSDQLPDELSFDAEVSSAIDDHVSAVDPHGDRAYADHEISVAVTQMQEFTNNTISSVVGAAPAALDTLQEIAAIIGDSEDISGSIVANIAAKAPLESPVFTGTVSLPEATELDGLVLTDIISGIEADITSETSARENAISNIEGTISGVDADVSALILTVSSLESNINNDIASVELSVTQVSNELTSVSGEFNSFKDSALASIGTNSTAISGIVADVDSLEQSLSSIQTDLDAAEVSIASVEANLDLHEQQTTNVHGIADTSELATLTDVNNAIIAADGVTTAVLNDYALLDSPALVGLPTAPTASAGTNTQQIATTEFVSTAVAALVGSAPEALNTLNELAEALGNDEDFATTISTQIASKANSSHTHLISDVTNLQSSLDLKSDKTSQINVMSGSHTIVSADVNNIREMSGGGTLSIPLDTAFWPVGQRVEIVQTGSSQVTISGVSGTTVNGTPGLKLRAQWSGATIIKRAANTFVVLGDLAV
jgi:hypothetical protein